MRRKENRKVPLETVLLHIGSRAHRIVGPWRYCPVLPRFMIEPAQIPAIVTSINNIRIQWIGYYITAFCTGCGFPIILGNALTCRPAFDPDGTVILLRTQYPVRVAIIGGYPVNLRSRLIHIGAPVSA